MAAAGAGNMRSRQPVILGQVNVTHRPHRAHYPFGWSEVGYVASESGKPHLQNISRVYGPETWEVYDLLRRSLDPRGPDVMLSLGIERLDRQSRILDVGCRDASHLVELVRATGASGVGLDPVTRLVDQARTAVSDAGLDDHIEIVEGVIQRLPLPDASFDVVCRGTLAAGAHALLQLARLRRQRDRIVAEAGEDIYAHVESNLHWRVHQLLGKLMPVVYILCRR